MHSDCIKELEIFFFFLLKKCKELGVNPEARSPMGTKLTVQWCSTREKKKKRKKQSNGWVPLDSISAVRIGEESLTCTNRVMGRQSPSCRWIFVNPSITLLTISNFGKPPFFFYEGELKLIHFYPCEEHLGSLTSWATATEREKKGKNKASILFTSGRVRIQKSLSHSQIFKKKLQVTNWNFLP